MSPRWARLAFYGAAAACLVQAWVLLPRFPPVTPSHFGFTGAPNAWMPASRFVGGYVTVVLLMSILLTVANITVRVTPIEHINLPHKAYWLAPERRRESLAYLDASLHWFGVGLFVLFFDAFRSVFRVSVGLAPGLDHAQLALGLFFAFAIGWAAAMFLRFGPAPSPRA